MAMPCCQHCFMQWLKKKPNKILIWLQFIIVYVEHKSTLSEIWIKYKFIKIIYEKLFAVMTFSDSSNGFVILVAITEPTRFSHPSSFIAMWQCINKKNMIWVLVNIKNPWVNSAARPFLQSLPMGPWSSYRLQCHSRYEWWGSTSITL